MKTYSVNEVMADIGYLASPDNEESLLAYIHEAKICGAVGVDFHPFVDRLVNDEGAYESGGSITGSPRKAGTRSSSCSVTNPEGTFVRGVERVEPEASWRSAAAHPGEQGRRLMSDMSEAFKKLMFNLITHEAGKIGCRVEEKDGNLVVHFGDNQMTVTFSKGDDA